MKKLFVLTTLFSCAHSMEIPEHCQRVSAASPPCVASNPNKKTPPQEANPSDGRFVVHEWGTFTSLVDEEGKTFTWYPLQGGAPLPNFVYSQWFQTLNGEWHHGKGTRVFYGEQEPIQGTVRMETPVVYFYSNKERDLSLGVKFNNGYITEWYPHAAVPIQNPNVIQWSNLRLTPGAEEKYPREEAGSEYYAARETDATPLISGPPGFSADGQPLPRSLPVNAGAMLHSDAYPKSSDSSAQPEKFLFYRGVGSFDVPLSVQITSSDEKQHTLLLHNQDAHTIPGAILFYRDGDRVWSKRLDAMKANEKSAATVVLGAPSGIEAVKEELISLLVEQDLYGRESSAMVKTWEEAWFEEGLRVFYIVPKKTTEAILPMTISETPDELVRVLVGRLDILTPELRQEIEQATHAYQSKVTAPSMDPCNAIKVKEVAERAHALFSLGRMVQPLLSERVAELGSLLDKQPEPPSLGKEQTERVILYRLLKDRTLLQECLYQTWPSLKAH